MKSNFFSITLIFILFSAIQNMLFAQNNVATIDIAGALESKEVVNMTDYFSSIEYVPLGEGQLWIPEAITCNIFYADNDCRQTKIKI